MAIYAAPRLRRLFSQLQTTGTYPANFRTINNSTGTWDQTGVKFIPVAENAVQLTPLLPKTPNPLLTGTRSTRPGILGRKAASWSLGLQVIPNGSAGVVPDTDHIWQNIFGTAASISAGVSATYAFTDTGFFPFALFDFYHGASSLTQRCIWGCFTESFAFNYNSNIFTCSLSGSGGYMLDSTNFSAEDTTAKAGLTAYPTEPGSATQNGTILPGFFATVSLDSQSVELKLRSLNVQGTTGYVVIGDVVGDAYPIVAVGGPRLIGLNMGFLDDDTSALNDIKTKAKSNTSVDCSIVLGQTAGAKIQMDFKSIQLVTPETTDESSAIVMSNFGTSYAHASAVGSIDDFTLIWK